MTHYISLPSLENKVVEMAKLGNCCYVFKKLLNFN